MRIGSRWIQNGLDHGDSTELTTVGEARRGKAGTGEIGDRRPCSQRKTLLLPDERLQLLLDGRARSRPG